MSEATTAQLSHGLWYDYAEGKIIGQLQIHMLAWSLAGVNRYGGWTTGVYWSVASHECLVAEIIGAMPDYDYLTVFGGLHHDDHEALTGDPSSPYILSMSAESRAELKLAQRRADGALWRSLGIWGLLGGTADSSRSGVIRAADLAALEAERRILYAERRTWLTESMVNPKMLEIGSRIMASDFGKITGGQLAADRYVSHHKALLERIGAP